MGTNPGALDREAHSVCRKGRDLVGEGDFAGGEARSKVEGKPMIWGVKTGLPEKVGET